MNIQAVSEVDDIVATGENSMIEKETNDFTVGYTKKDGSSYKEATNRYDDGNTTYYFVTGNPKYETKANQTERIPYEGWGV